MLRNPRGLVVTVCTTRANMDCRVYRDSGPLFVGDAGIGSISVDRPDD